MEDIEAAVQEFSAAFVVEPARIMEPTIPWTYRGKPAADIRMKAAHYMWGDIELELIQWIAGESAYKEHLERKGFGLHHIGILSSAFDRDLKEFEEHGINPIQMVRNTSERGIAYMDTEKPLGLVVELMPGFVAKRRDA
ncbi:MAG: VOC family protein [Chloroflexi bacterium]|nr:VOC family protein [Chloroflexota bacterium]